jgi:hypothetical protein
MSEEQGDMAPTRITKWDVLALFSNIASEILLVLSTNASMACEMLQTQASFVDKKESFHEYAALTIETLQQGD